MAVLAWTLLPLAALHLWLARRARPVLRFQLLLDLALAAVLGPALVRGADLNPVRCLEATPPYTAWQWSAATRLQPAQSDLVLQFHPWWAEARRLLACGRLPLVSDRIGGGMPLLAHGQVGLWAPVMAPVWALGPERGSTVMALWKLELAGLGAFLLLARGFRVRSGGAAVAGLAYGCGCYQVAWLLVPLAWVTAILPWAWWAVAAATRRRARVRTVALVGCAGGWLLGCGLHPETAAIACGSALLAGLVLHPRRWPRLLGMVAVAAPVALALAWPTIAAVRASAKLEQYRTSPPNRAGLPGAVRAAALRQLLAPAANGHPARGDFRAPYPYPAAATGCGGLVLGLLAAGRVRRRHRRALLAALASLLVAAVLAYRVPPLDALLVLLPPFDRMTLPRFAALVPVALAVWAGLAADGLAAGRRRRLAVRLAAPLLVLAAVLLSSPWSLAPADQLLVATGLVLCAAAALAPTGGRWLAGGVAVETALLALGVNPVAAPADRAPRPPLVVELERLVAAEGGRVLGLGGALPPNLASRYGLADLRAFDPVRPAPFARLGAVLGEAEPVLGGPLAAAPARLCGAWSARFLVTPPGGDPPGWERAFADRSGEIWRNPHWLPELRAVGRTVAAPEEAEGWRLLAAATVNLRTTAVVPAGTAGVAAARVAVAPVESRPDRVRALASCDGPCLVLLARPWAPGWQALVDGSRAPLVRANLAGLGVMVPSGEHRVELRYRPWGW